MSSLTALPKIRISIGIFATETRYFIAKITLKKNDQCAFSGNEIRLYIYLYIYFCKYIYCMKLKIVNSITPSLGFKCDSDSK